MVDIATESNSKKTHTTEIYNDAYRKIEYFLKQSSQCKPGFSKAKPSRKFISLFITILSKIGLKAVVDKLWEFFLWYFYESITKNIRVETSVGTTFYGFAESQKLDDIYHMLADDKSKDVFDWFLKYRLAYIMFGPVAVKVFPYLDFEPNKNRDVILKKWNLCKINGYVFDYQHDWNEVENTWINEQYLLTGKCEPEKGEVVIDAGGFQGGTAIWFADKVGERGKVFSFEPLEINYQKMKGNIQRNNLEKIIEPINEGLWDSNTRLWITNNNSASVCSVEHSDLEIKVTTLDSFVKNQGLERVDFIKMDIEGAELNALKGALHTIMKFKPKLAISVYHLPGDIYDIPVLIKSWVPEYKLYLSHKCKDWCETVLFAAIDEKYREKVIS